MINKTVYFILLIFIFIDGCQPDSRNPGSSGLAIPVVTQKVAISSFSRDILLSGNVEGIKTVRLGFLVAGKIDFIAANEGEAISKNTLLSSIDPASYAIAKELADIQVNQVQDEYDRLKLMHDNNSLSESDFVKISFGLQQAKAQQKLHTKNLADTKLYSPIEGVLLKKLAEVGEITGVGIPLFVVSDILRVKINTYIPENELHNIRIKQTAKVYISSLDKEYEGKITEVGSAADPASRAFSLKIEVENPGLLIRPGMIAEVAIPSATKEEYLTIPSGAIMHDYSDQSFVFVIDPSKNIAYRRNVSPGKLVNDLIEVVSGLEINETVVTGGQQKLNDGSRVIIQK